MSPTSINQNSVFSGRLTVVGLGYIGLPTATVLATRGVKVVGVDVDARRVESINRGEPPFVEPDLAAAMAGAVAMGNLTATKEVPESDAYIVAVPTPFVDGHAADLSYVHDAVKAIAPQLRGGEIVIIESTSPPGTALQASQWLAELRPDLHLPHESRGTAPQVHVAHCPERVLPGRIMIEMLTNDRVVGGITAACAAKAASIYRVFCQGEILLTDAASAEMAKLVENAFRDVNIAFANELSLICDHLELDVWEVIEMANRHPRVNILNPGPGVGGHCIAVDPWFIIGAAREQSRLIATARDVNDTKPGHLADQIVCSAERFRNPTIGCLGLAYKANIDDLRESPAVHVVEEVCRRLPETRVLVAEPYVAELPTQLRDLPNLTLVTPREAVEQSDIVALLVDHDQFKGTKRVTLTGKVVYDAAGVFH